MITLHQERIICSISAAVKYHVPANILLAVAEQEHGKPKQWVNNTNGTQDVGMMQFNTAYLRDLSKYGITANDVAQNNCYAFNLAAWRIHYQLQHGHGDIWTRAADYHSYTPKYNAIYRKALIKRAAKWQYWLTKNFHTYHQSPVQPIIQVQLSHKPYNQAAAHALAAVFLQGANDDYSRAV